MYSAPEAPVGSLGIMSFFRKHPILLLLALSPGIPEYLSSSSPVSAVVSNPIMFLFQIVANLGLYGPGVLLVREALVRWKKGWSSSLALGAAYGILEEGIALSTMFDPNSSSRSLHGYGWWLGVNWVWSPSLMLFHAVYSITLPILLLGITLPETKDRSLLGRRQIIAVFAIFLADVASLMAVVHYSEHFSIGFPRFLGSALAISILVFAGAKAPRTMFTPKFGMPTRRPIAFCILGLAFFPVIIFGESIGGDLNAPAWLLVPVVLLLEGIILRTVLRTIGSMNNERHVTALAAGLLIPIAIFGVVAEIRLPLVIGVDVLLVLFLRRVWESYEPTYSLTSKFDQQ